jgi:hypothetical protein
MMSAGLTTPPVAAAAVAHHGRVAPDPADPARIRRVSLAGVADGSYQTSQGPPDTGAQYRLTATGTIRPLGAAVVSGTFDTPGFIHGGQVTGTLKIAGSSGTLTLRLVEASPKVEDVSKVDGHGINTGGPGGRGSTSVSSGPIILVNDFEYTIIRGTGRYAHTRGSGVVEITTTPGFTGPTGPGIYNTPALPVTGSGRTTLTFR